MNVENIKKVRDLIAGLPAKRFAMNDWGFCGYSGAEAFLHDCGAAACIGGWAEVLIGGEKMRMEQVYRLMGLSEDEGDDLCFPHVEGSMHASVAQGVAVLDHLLETGEVDWAYAMANPADLTVTP